MSGRDGRRGKDERGICIIMIDEQMEMNTLKDMSRAEGQFTAEHVIRHSFHQFQYEKALPDIGNKVSKLEEEAAMLDASGEAKVAEYHQLKLEIGQLEKKMMIEITRPERVLYYLLPGRLIVVHKDSPRGTHFRLAGPRQKVYFKSDDVHACIVTCGDLCPGLNTWIIVSIYIILRAVTDVHRRQRQQFMTDHQPHVVLGAVNLSCTRLREDIYEVCFYLSICCIKKSCCRSCVLAFT